MVTTKKHLKILKPGYYSLTPFGHYQPLKNHTTFVCFVQRHPDNETRVIINDEKNVLTIEGKLFFGMQPIFISAVNLQSARAKLKQIKAKGAV
jgi:hypothetical protein